MNCVTCKHRYTGDAAVRLARAFWAHVATREDDDPVRLAVASNLGTVLIGQGVLPEARQILRDTLEVQRRVLGMEHPSTLTTANNLAYLLTQQGELSEAGQILRETLEVQRRVLGAEHPVREPCSVVAGFHGDRRVREEFAAVVDLVH